MMHKKIKYVLNLNVAIKTIAKTISPLWFYKTKQKPIGKSAKALKL
jgi:hypothetical protein